MRVSSASLFLLLSVLCLTSFIAAAEIRDKDASSAMMMEKRQANGVAITTCPTSQAVYSVNSKTYTICQSTDFRVYSYNILHKVASNTDCAKSCSADSNCVKAVYDKQTKDCHFKSDTSNSNWFTDTRFDVITVPNPATISTCPVTETTTTSGSNTYAACVNTDYKEASQTITNNIASMDACTALCIKTSGCTRAVLDKANKVCHTKSSTATFTWFSDPRFDSVRVYGTPVNVTKGTPLTVCPGGKYTLTTQDGSTFSGCPRSDFPIASRAIINGINSVGDCAGQCSQSFGCVKAVFDNINKVCHLKGSPLDGSWSADPQFDTLVLVPNTGAPGNSTSVIGSCGVSAQHLFVGADDSVYILDKSEANPLKAPGSQYSATAAIWSLSDGSCRPQSVTTNQFCAAGAPLADGTWVQGGGNPSQNNQNQGNGLRAIRRLVPCSDGSCSWGEGQSQLQVDRWYPSAETVADGSMIIFGGYNAQVFMPYPQSGNTPTAEYFPSKGAPIKVDILDRAWPFSLYPLITTLSDGRYFIVAGNQTTIFNAANSAETRLDNMPNGPRTYPSGGSSVLLPLTPANGYTETLMFCGGTNLPDWGNAGCPPAGSHQVPANNKCDFISPLKDAKWTSGPNMPAGRVMGNFIILPDNKIVITNGAYNGVQGFGCGFPSESQASNPANVPHMYDPVAKTWQALATTNVNRGYHSSANLLPDGSILTAGSAPHNDVVTDQQPFPTEFRLEKIYPPYFNKPRPDNSAVPNKYPYGGASFNITFGSTNEANGAYIRLIRGGWSTHGLQMGQRSYELQRTVNGNTVTFQGLGTNKNIFPPGAALAFLVVNGVPAIGKYSLVGPGTL